jgi:hypothetical protein
MTRLLQLFPEIPGKVQSCVTRRFLILSFCGLTVHCVATPSGVMLAPGIMLMTAGLRGMAHCAAISLSNALSNADLFSFGCVD